MDIDAKTVIGHDCDVEVKGTLRIRVGGSLITLAKDGIVIETKGAMTLKAETVVLDGMHRVQVKGADVSMIAPAILTLKGGMVKIN